MLLLSPRYSPYPIELQPYPHNYVDDLESFFYILLFETMLHLDLNGFGRDTELVKVIRDLFDQAEPDIVAYRLNGGRDKERFIIQGLPSIQPSKSKPLQDLIQDLCEYFDSRYHRISYLPGNEKRLEKYENPDAILALFDKALKQNDWPEEDDKLSEDLFKNLGVPRYHSSKRGSTIQSEGPAPKKPKQGSAQTVGPSNTK
jgi:hypothetical protein